MNNFALFTAEWNSINGFFIKLIEFDDRAILGVNFSSCFFYLDLLFIRIRIFGDNPNH
jgi:hypothetical protein